MKELKEIKYKQILIDTNILINCGSENFGVDFKKILRNLSDNGNILNISIITGYEIVKRYSGKGEKKIFKYYITLLSYINNIIPDKLTMYIAGSVASKLYKTDGNGYKEDNDFMICSTAIQYKDFLFLTCDKNFKRPFWKQVARTGVKWENEDDIKIETVFLLEFDGNEWDKKFKDGLSNLVEAYK